MFTINNPYRYTRSATYVTQGHFDGITNYIVLPFYVN